jgi:hypothetical protein
VKTRRRERKKKCKSIDVASLIKKKEGKRERERQYDILHFAFE